MRTLALYVLLILVGAALGLPLLAASGDAGSSTTGYKLVYTPARQVNCTYSATWSVTGQTCTGWTFFELKPPATGRQRITTALQPNGQPGATQGTVHLPLLYLKTTSGGSQLSLTETYQGQLCATALVPLNAGEAAPRVTPLTAKEQQFYTQADSCIDYNSPTVTSWLANAGLHRKAGESDLDLARRVFLSMRATFKYNMNHPTQQKASDVVRDKITVCGGLSWAFAAAMRANGVPARVLSLLKADQDYNVGGSDLGHATDEFFCQGIGWVPADLTGGVCASSEQNAMRYFAQDDGAFLITFNGYDDFSVDMSRLGGTLVRAGSGNNGGDNIVQGIPWGINANGGTGGKLKSTDRWVTQVTVIAQASGNHQIPGSTLPAGTQTSDTQATGAQTLDTQTPKNISSAGKPLAAAVGQTAGYLVWRDNNGWHVHSNRDGQTHQWGIDIRPYTPPAHKLASAIRAMNHEDPVGDPLYAVGIEDDQGLNADVQSPTGAKYLLFILKLDGGDAPDRIWIGRKAVHPLAAEFLLRVPTTAARPSGGTGGSATPQGSATSGG